jgi:hypothetical protein
MTVHHHWRAVATSHLVGLLMQASYPLFTVTDGALDANTTYSEFETRLVHGLLLEPGLVMADAYFFSSNNLQKHVVDMGKGSISLFEAALRRGLIVPALREPARDFVEVLGYLRAQQMQGNYESLDYLAARLSGSCDLEARQTLWRGRSGANYHKLIRRCLLGRMPPGVDPEIWQLTDVLRHTGIAEARRITKSRPQGDGLRRGELYRVAGSILGVFDLDDPRAIGRNEILSRYALLVGDASVEHRAAKEFFDWVDELHRMNFAESLGALPSIFTSTSNNLAVLQRGFPSIIGSIPLQAPSDEINRVIKIPSVRRLLRWPPEKLLDARDYGIDWRASARRFMEDPRDATRHQAQEALEAYAKKLRSISPGPPFTDLSVKAFAIKMAPLLLTTAAGFVQPEGPYIATVASAGYLAYQYLLRGRNEKVYLSPGLNIIPNQTGDQLAGPS